MAMFFKLLPTFWLDEYFKRESLSNLIDKTQIFLCYMDGKSYSNSNVRNKDIYQVLCTFPDYVFSELEKVFCEKDLFEWYWFLKKVQEAKAERQYAKILDLSI